MGSWELGWGEVCLFFCNLFEKSKLEKEETNNVKPHHPPTV